MTSKRSKVGRPRIGKGAMLPAERTRRYRVKLASMKSPNGAAQKLASKFGMNLMALQKIRRDLDRIIVKLKALRKG